MCAPPPPSKGTTVMLTDIVRNVLDRLEGVRPNGNGYKALCPAHDDRDNPSLSVGVGEDGRVLLKCFVGCDTKDIVAAIGLVHDQATSW